MSASDAGELLRARPAWELTPLEGVGPLRFGMVAEEAASVLPEAVELRRFQAEPFSPQVVGVLLALGPGGPAVYEYFDASGRLFCVAVDAVLGPQVVLDGMELAGGVPAELELWLSNLPESMGGLCYGPRANPGINELGLVLRVQETEIGVLTRPVMVGREWADRCADDWEGRIPECEWVGRMWPHPFLEGKPQVWPVPGESPPWAKVWSPPF